MMSKILDTRKIPGYQITIKYPAILPKEICDQIEDYLSIHRYSKKRCDLMKKLIENHDMIHIVFPKLLKITENKKIKITNNNICHLPAAHAVSQYIDWCTKIYLKAKKIDPIEAKLYSSNCNALSKKCKEIKKIIYHFNQSGISHLDGLNIEIINNIDFINYLDAIVLSAKKASKNPAIYVYGNLGMTRKKKNARYNFFITRLSMHTEELFKQPLYKVIEIITNLMFDLNATTPFNEEAIKVKCNEFKKSTKTSKSGPSNVSGKD